MNKKALIRYLLLFSFIGLGGLLGYILGKYEVLDFITPEKEDFHLWYFILILLLYFVVIGIHELGHLLTGLAQGFSFYLFIVGFLGIKKNEQGKIVAYFNKDLNSFGGLSGTMPKTFDGETMGKMARMIIAGPITSFVLAVLCILLAQWSPQPLRFFLAISGFFSIAIFLATTLPARTGMFYTDRKRYQRLTSKGPEAEIEMASIQASTQQIAGRPISEIPESTLRKITQDESPLFRFLGYFYLYEHFRQSAPERIPEIQQAMDALKPDLPATFVRQMEAHINTRVNQ